ncbi:hypothetical protein E0T84_13200 [Mycobacterium sp. DBP42]|nr:hypothetical protein E0T84_13200 [Mycobacterium sp. DBP42]
MGHASAPFGKFSLDRNGPPIRARYREEAPGPTTNLPYHHEVGMGGRAFAPFDSGGWNPRYDVPVPLPSTEFGPVDSPPSVPQTRAPSGPTQF